MRQPRERNLLLQVMRTGLLDRRSDRPREHHVARRAGGTNDRAPLRRDAEHPVAEPAADAKDQGDLPDHERRSRHRCGSGPQGCVRVVTYVSNIYKYYLAYKLLEAQTERRTAAKAQVVQSQSK